MPITRESMFAQCADLGEEEVKSRIPRWRSDKAKFAREWLSDLESKRESSRMSRQEQRDEESLSISRKALSVSRRAISISRNATLAAISAVIIAAISIIIQIVTIILK